MPRQAVYFAVDWQKSRVRNKAHNLKIDYPTIVHGSREILLSTIEVEVINVVESALEITNKSLRIDK